MTGPIGLRDCGEANSASLFLARDASASPDTAPLLHSVAGLPPGRCGHWPQNATSGRGSLPARLVDSAQGGEKCFDVQ